MRGGDHTRGGRGEEAAPVRFWAWKVRLLRTRQAVPPRLNHLPAISICRRKRWAFSIKFNISWLFTGHTDYDPQDLVTPLVGIHPRERTAGTQANTAPMGQSSAAHSSGERWIQPSVPQRMDKQNAFSMQNGVLASRGKESGDTLQCGATLATLC